MYCHTVSQTLNGKSLQFGRSLPCQVCAVTAVYTKHEAMNNLCLLTLLLYSLETPDLGELLTLVVSHNSKGRRPAWFLHGVELAHVPSGVRYSWRVAAWYDAHTL